MQIKSLVSFAIDDKYENLLNHLLFKHDKCKSELQYKLKKMQFKTLNAISVFSSYTLCHLWDWNPKHIGPGNDNSGELQKI